jgi:pimeloyl-ACP methyl ester carboxylesterase
VSVDLLLIAGLLCDHRLWSGQTQALADAARTRTPDLTPYESIAKMADAVLRTAPERFALAGFSMGGCVALEIIFRAPLRVQRLALLSTNAAGLLPSVRRHYEESIASIEAGELDRYLADAFPRYVAPTGVSDRALWEAFSAMATSLGAAVAVRQMRALLEYPGFGGNLRDIACPTVLVCGDEDHRTPVAIHQEMARQIFGAQLRVIEGSGHFTPLEQPTAVAFALREWLQTSPAQRP